MPRVFSDFLQGYLLYTQESEAPDAFNFWTGVSMIAGAVRRHVWIDQGRFEWSPNFYIILVAPPGVATKTTAMGAGMNILSQVKGVQFGPESLTWQALGAAMQTSVEIFWTGGEEGLGEKVVTSPMTIAAGELGTLLKVEDDGLTSMLIAMWDGQRREAPFVHATRTNSPIEIRNPWLNIIGCTTPAWLQAHFPETMIGGGLTSRIIFVYAERKKKLVPYPAKSWRGKTVTIGSREFSFKDLERGLALDLAHIASLKGPMQLTVEAEAWGEKWYVEHQNNPPIHLRPDRYGGYRSRKQTHLHKLAMIVSLSRRDDLLITDEDLIIADALLTSVEPSMIKVFNSIGKVEQARHVDMIVNTINNFAIPMGLDELFALVSNQMSAWEFQEAVKAGTQAGLLIGQSMYDPNSGSQVRRLRAAPVFSGPAESPEAGPQAG